MDRFEALSIAIGVAYTPAAPQDNVSFSLRRWNVFHVSEGRYFLGELQTCSTAFQYLNAPCPSQPHPSLRDHLLVYTLVPRYTRYVCASGRTDTSTV